VLAWPLHTLKHHFTDITKDFQKADYEFEGPFAYIKPLKQFQVAFFDDECAKNKFARPFDTFKHHFINLLKAVS
jgi:hypothetical protein